MAVVWFTDFLIDFEPQWSLYVTLNRCKSLLVLVFYVSNHIKNHTFRWGDKKSMSLGLIIYYVSTMCVLLLFFQVQYVGEQPA